jgi:hypothetical protein
MANTITKELNLDLKIEEVCRDPTQTLQKIRKHINVLGSQNSFYYHTKSCLLAKTNHTPLANKKYRKA